MTREEITAKFTDVFRARFERPALVLSDSTTAADVPGWDSLANINLILAMEKAFGIKLTTRDVRGMKNVGDFISLIEKKLA